MTATQPGLDLDDYITRRTSLIRAWEAWDEAPGNAARATAMANAIVAYAGDAHVDCQKFLAAVRRAGGANRESALDAWETDW